MKKFIATAFLLALSFQSVAGESWKRETYESGESVYSSNNVLGIVTAMQMLLGERGVGFIYATATSASFSRKFCFISVDDAPNESCEIDYSQWPIIKTPQGLANRISSASTAKLTLRICEPAGFCDFANDGGSTKQFIWTWDEPLSKTFPDFKPYKVSK